MQTLLSIVNLSFNYFHAIEKRLLRYERIEVLSDGGHGFRC